MKAKLGYRCGECGDIHDDYDEARECCEPTVYEVYSCGHCREEFGSHEELAGACCADVEPDAPPIINQAELEALGQLRLGI